MVFFVYGKMDASIVSRATWDYHKYLAISSAAPLFDESIPQPFAFRLLGPYLLGLLPWDIFQIYYIATILVALFLLVVFYCFLCSNGIRSNVAAVTVLLFSFNKYFFGYPVWNHFQINDLISLILLIALYWCMLRHNWSVLCVLLMLGSLTRETSMLVIPVAIIYLLESGAWRKEWIPFVISVVPGIVLFLFVRMTVPYDGGSSLWDAFLMHSSKLLSPGRVYALVINSFAPLVFVPVVLCEVTISFFRKRLHGLAFLLLVLGTALFGSNDERLMAPSFLIFYFLIARMLQDYFSDSPWLLWSIVLLVFPTSLDYVIGLHLLPNIAVMYTLSIISMAVISSLFLYRKYRLKAIANQPSVAIQ